MQNSISMYRLISLVINPQIYRRCNRLILFSELSEVNSIVGFFGPLPDPLVQVIVVGSDIVLRADRSGNISLSTTMESATGARRVCVRQCARVGLLETLLAPFGYGYYYVFTPKGRPHARESEEVDPLPLNHLFLPAGHAPA